jgi:tetratricopeptide (TPR) repeat protein
MVRNPWFTLVVGLMLGLTLGYVLAERQPVPPAKALVRGAAAESASLPEGHPPVPDAAMDAGAPEVERQAAELRGLLAKSPGDFGLMVALGNLYFDAGRWEEARMWYEQGLEVRGGDANVLTDLAVAYRNLGQPERSLQILDQVVAAEPDHWQAWYNRVVVLHFDLHRHDEAEQALEKLETMAKTNPQVPDLSGIAAQVRG